jgi:hypothetical protein
MAGRNIHIKLLKRDVISSRDVSELRNINVNFKRN